MNTNHPEYSVPLPSGLYQSILAILRPWITAGVFTTLLLLSLPSLLAQTGNGLKGEYYNNLTLTGSPALTRTDTTINFNWSDGSPGGSVAADNFSVRWTGQVQPQYSETYRFYTNTDDGVRLWVNGVPLVNDWTGHPATENSQTIQLTAGQKYDVVMEFFDSGYQALAQLSWSSASQAKQIIPQNRLYSTTPGTPDGTGLKGEYYSNKTHSGAPALTRTDSTINFNWAGSPGGSIPADSFSVRWTGQVQPEFSQTYTFYANTDDGVRLWVNGVSLINDWTEHGIYETNGSIALSAGVKYDITMEFFENIGGANAELRWSSASQPKQIIPQLRLYPVMGGGGSGGSALTIANFSFETPALGNGNFQYSPTGGNWTFNNGTGVAANNSAFTGSNPNAPLGSQVAFIQGGSNFSQPITGFTAGVPYTLTFSAAQRNYVNQIGHTWRVKLDGVVIASFNPPQSATSYTDYTSQFSTTGGTFVLTFEGVNVNSGDNTVFIDNIRIAPSGSQPVAPAAPTNLAATSTSSSQINLTWNDQSNNESGFQIERKSGAGSFSQIATPGANATSFQDNNLTAATNYVYRIRAVNGSATSAFSNEANATTQSQQSSGSGLKGEYYSNRTFTGSPALTRTDATVNFDWTNSPGGSLPADQFSVRWTGQIQPQYSQTYTFYTRTDDGVRLWVNGTQIINDWTEHGILENTGSISLTGGVKYDIRMEFFENVGGAYSQLLWSSASQPKEVIPQARLYPASGSPQTEPGFVQIQLRVIDGYAANIASTYVYVSNNTTPNQAPVIHSVSANTTSVAPFGTVNLSVNATDANGDPLKYFWVAPGGQLGWSRAANETWKAASLGGLYKIQVMVGDGKTWVSGYVDVNVNGQGNNGVGGGVGNHPPAIHSVVAQKTTVTPGETITLSYTGSDRDAQGINDGGWYSSTGTVNGTGLSGITWTAPSSTASARPVRPGFLQWPREAPDQATCPFPLSTDLVGIGFTGRVHAQQVADTFMPAWASDGTLWSPWQDGALLTPPYDNLSNWPSSSNTQDNGWCQLMGDDPMDLLLVKAGNINGDKTGWMGRYPAAMFTKDGVIYYGTRFTQNYDANGNPTGWPAPLFTYGPLAGFHYSTNNGNTWTTSPYTGTSNWMFPGDPLNANGKTRFGQPYLVDFGKNQNGSPDGKVYFVSTGSVDNDPSPDNAIVDSVYLCRVTLNPSNPAQINNTSFWEFYAGNGVWSNNATAAQPIASWQNHFNGATITYNPGLNKYILWGYKNGYVMNNGALQFEDFDTFCLESSSLTGPYKMVQYFKSFGTQGYYPNMPSKFMSADGKNAWLWNGANFAPTIMGRPEDPLGSGYRLTEFEIRLLTPGDIQ